MIGRERFQNRQPKKPQQGAQSAPQVKPQPGGKGSAARTDKPKPAAARIEKVKALCGHEVDCPHYVKDKPGHAEGRKKNIMEKKCAACRKAAHEERQRREMEAGAERRKQKALMKKPLFRLPNGSYPIIEPFNEANHTWTGRLLVPEGAGHKVYGPMSSGSIHFLLQRLGWAWFSEAHPEAAKGHKPAAQQGSEKPA